MLNSVLTAPEKTDAATGTEKGSLLERMIDAWSRSFELLAEARSRFPIDM
jgi:hypothetical protein